MTKNDEIITELKKYYNSLKSDSDNFINLFGPVTFPISIDDGVTREIYRWYVWNESEKEMSFEDLLESIKKMGSSKNYDSLLVYGDFENAENPLVRVHSCCFTGDVVFSTRCDCGQQLKTSFELITKNGSGAVAYLANQEGRGIGLFAKAITHKVQDNLGLDSYKSCTVLGIEDEIRKYEGLGTLFNYFRGDKGICVLSNNPEKLNGLIENGIKVKDICPLNGFENEDNKKVLNQKKMRAKEFKINL